MPKTKRNTDRPLTPKEKNEIIAVISVGCSLKVASRYINATISHIKRTAASDQEFGEKLRRAELKAEITSMKNISEAAQQGRYWKASAWILERKNPDEYAPRLPGTFTPEQLRFIVTKISNIITDEIRSPSYRKRLLRRLDALMESISGQE